MKASTRVRSLFRSAAQCCQRFVYLCVLARVFQSGECFLRQCLNNHGMRAFFAIFCFVHVTFIDKSPSYVSFTGHGRIAQGPRASARGRRVHRSGALVCRADTANVAAAAAALDTPITIYIRSRQRTNLLFIAHLLRYLFYLYHLFMQSIKLLFIAHLSSTVQSSEREKEKEWDIEMKQRRRSKMTGGLLQIYGRQKSRSDICFAGGLCDL